MKLHEIIKELSTKHNPLFIAIDGKSGSGKSTLAKDLQKRFNATLIHMDDYFLPPERKTKERLQESGGNVDVERLYKEVHQVKDLPRISVRKYNCQDDILEDPQVLYMNRLVIVEGVYSLHPKLRDTYDLKILIQVDEEEQLKRIKERSGEHLFTRYVNEWIPLENHYFKTEKLEEIADVILKN